MSMILELCRASDTTLRGLLANPEPGRLHEFLDSEPERTDLDKAWHGLHWLLTGTDWGGTEPLCYLVMGGQQIGEESLSYGPARALLSREVVAFDEALKGIAPEQLAKRYDPSAMMAADIYPQVWDRPEEDNLAYLMDYYAGLREFVSGTSRKGLGLFIYLG